MLEPYLQRCSVLASIRKRQAPAREISLYLHDISQTFHSSSEAEYSEKLEEYSRTWDSAFHQYYIEEIHPDRAKICRWALEPLGVTCNPYSGVTENHVCLFLRIRVFGQIMFYNVDQLGGTRVSRSKSMLCRVNNIIAF